MESQIAGTMTDLANAVRSVANIENSMTCSEMISTLKSLTFPDMIKVFLDGSIRTITIHGVTKIRDSAFKLCTYLEYVSLPNYLLTIGSQAFSGCASLKNITIPASVTTIAEDAFKDCSIKFTFEGDIPDGYPWGATVIE